MKPVNSEQVEAAVGKALGWLTSQLGDDGSFGPEAFDLRSYYKAPAALAVAGRVEEAHRVAGFVKKTLMKPDGDFRSDGRKSEAEYFAQHRYAYLNGWLVLGLHRIGRFDMSVPGMDYIRTFQDQEYGGFLSAVDESFRPVSGRQDLASTCSCGMAALFCGQVAVASRAGDFLIHLVQIQPDFSRALYTHFIPGHGVVTQIAPEDLAQRVCRIGPAYEPYWLPGFATGFLAKLYLATCEQRYLEAAQRYSEFFLRCPEDRFCTYMSGKAAWACAVLYRITGEACLLDNVHHVVQYIVRTQRPDGTWLNRPFYDDMAKQPLSQTFDITAELPYWLCEIGCELATVEAV